jgi:hypothetical protein
MIRSAFLRSFSTHQARSSKAAGSNYKLFARFVKRDPSLAGFGCEQAPFHGLAFEQIGGLFLRLQLPPKVNGDDHPGDVVVLVRNVLNLAHDGSFAALRGIGRNSFLGDKVQDVFLGEHGVV